MLPVSCNDQPRPFFDRQQPMKLLARRAAWAWFLPRPRPFAIEFKPAVLHFAACALLAVATFLAAPSNPAAPGPKAARAPSTGALTPVAVTVPAPQTASGQPFPGFLGMQQRELELERQFQQQEQAQQQRFDDLMGQAEHQYVPAMMPPLQATAIGPMVAATDALFARDPRDLLGVNNMP